VSDVVFDANVLASGFVRKQAAPGRLLIAWEAGLFELFTSDHILAEVERTFAKPYFRARLTPEDANAAMTLLRRSARSVPLSIEVHGVATHPEDDVVPATAVSARAEYLVTGDRQLLALGGYQGVRIISPRTFLEILGVPEAANGE
jgi:putative PIN family toxin of toxin-antitoxin system